MKIYKYKWSGKHDGKLHTDTHYEDTEIYLRNKKMWQDHSNPWDYYQNVKTEILEVLDANPMTRLPCRYQVTDTALILEDDYGQYGFRKDELAELISVLQAVHDSLREVPEIEA